MVTVKGVLSWWWPTIVAVLLAVFAPAVEIAVVFGLLVVQLLVLIMKMSRFFGALYAEVVHED